MRYEQLPIQALNQSEWSLVWEGSRCQLYLGVIVDKLWFQEAQCGDAARDVSKLACFV